MDTEAKDAITSLFEELNANYPNNFNRQKTASQAAQDQQKFLLRSSLTGKKSFRKALMIWKEKSEASKEK